MPNANANMNSGGETMLNGSDLEALRSSLSEKRVQLLTLYEHDVRVGQESTDDNADDSIDRANNSFNRELMFSLSTNERETLLQVEEAVERLDGKDYGVCIHCDEQIGLPRLKALPWARYCIRCQELDEIGALQH